MVVLYGQREGDDPFANCATAWDFNKCGIFAIFKLNAINIVYNRVDFILYKKNLNLL